jgi:uncharacterized SAM-binding protein YcdF (DUF218 family)
MDIRAVRTEPPAGPTGQVKRWRRWPRRLLAIAAFGLTLYASSGWWLPAAGRWLDVGEPPRVADYCLVLSGGFGSRPFGAAALYRRGYIRRGIWLTRVAFAQPIFPLEIDSTAAARRVLTTVGVPNDRIAVLDGECATTFDEAKSLERMLASHPEATVAVVTSDYHTRRTRWIFRRILGERADRLQFISVPTDFFSAEDWWKVEQGFVSYSKEFLKLPFYYLYYGWGLVWIGLAVAAIVGLRIVRRLRRREEPGGRDIGAPRHFK